MAAVSAVESRAFGVKVRPGEFRCRRAPARMLCRARAARKLPPATPCDSRNCFERLLLMLGNMGGSTAEAHALQLLPCALSAGGWTRTESHGAFLRPRQPLLLK